MEKLLETFRKNEFSKEAANKINIQKSVVFLYTNNEQKEKLRKQIPYAIVPPKKQKTRNKYILGQLKDTDERN